MKILGYSEGYHDAAVTVIENGKILYASHAERYSKKKNDKYLHPDQLQKADKIAFTKNPFGKILDDYTQDKGGILENFLFLMTFLIPIIKHTQQQDIIPHLLMIVI